MAERDMQRFARALPAFGFKVACFPLKIQGAGARRRDFGGIGVDTGVAIKVVMLSCFGVACCLGGIRGVRMSTPASDSNSEKPADLGE